MIISSTKVTSLDLYIVTGIPCSVIEFIGMHGFSRKFIASNKLVIVSTMVPRNRILTLKFFIHICIIVYLINLDATRSATKLVDRDRGVAMYLSVP